MDSSNAVGSRGIAHERSYWYGLAEQYDTFKKHNRYETADSYAKSANVLESSNATTPNTGN